MTSIEEFKLYLPKYLSPDTEESLFQEIKKFPDNIDSRIYTEYHRNEKILFQGDGIDGMLFVDLPKLKPHNAPGIVISNTCDIDPGNIRSTLSRVIYSPIMNLNEYCNMIEQTQAKTGQALLSHVNSIKSQYISNIFFLPKGGRLKGDSIVFFDWVCSCSREFFTDNKIIGDRIFTLSQYGFYLFLFKLSIHLTRIREGVERDRPE